MLRVTVELMPGGRLQGRRTLATADIGRIRSGALADYQIDMEEDLLPNASVRARRVAPKNRICGAISRG